MSVKGYKFSIIRRISFKDLMYSMVILVNNTMLYMCIRYFTKVLFRSLHFHEISMLVLVLVNQKKPEEDFHF